MKTQKMQSILDVLDKFLPAGPAAATTARDIAKRVPLVITLRDPGLKPPGDGHRADTPADPSSAEAAREYMPFGRLVERDFRIPNSEDKAAWGDDCRTALSGMDLPPCVYFYLGRPATPFGNYGIAIERALTDLWDQIWLPWDSGTMYKFRMGVDRREQKEVRSFVKRVIRRLRDRSRRAWMFARYLGCCYVQPKGYWDDKTPEQADAIRVAAGERPLGIVHPDGYWKALERETARGEDVSAYTGCIWEVQVRAAFVDLNGGAGKGVVWWALDELALLNLAELPFKKTAYHVICEVLGDPVTPDSRGHDWAYVMKKRICQENGITYE